MEGYGNGEAGDKVTLLGLNEINEDNNSDDDVYWRSLLDLPMTTHFTWIKSGIRINFNDDDEEEEVARMVEVVTPHVKLVKWRVWLKLWQIA